MDGARLRACLPRLPFLGDRVPALSNGGAIIAGDFPGPGKADRGIGPQPYVPAPSMDYNSLDPRFAPGRGDVEVEAVAIAVPAGFAQGSLRKVR